MQTRMYKLIEEAARLASSTSEIAAAVSRAKLALESVGDLTRPSSLIRGVGRSESAERLALQGSLAVEDAANGRIRFAERTKFTSASSDSEKMQKLEESTGLSLAGIRLVREEVERYGLNPRKFLPEAMQTYQVVGFGEAHTYLENPQRLLTTSLIPDFKAAGGTHFVVELMTSAQPALDRFARNDLLDTAILPRLARRRDYVDMLYAARNSELRNSCCKF